jgi:transcriptional regulator of arginine metabolism
MHRNPAAAREAAFLFWDVYLIMKPERHTVIREIVGTTSVVSQHELRRKLVHRGFDVTQATLSRDIREMRLYKGPRGYTLPNGGDVDDDDEPTVEEVLGQFALKVKQAQNQLVVITTQGGAQPVALAIDHEEWPETVGTIAGDDTVLIICPDSRQAARLLEHMKEMIG